MTTYQDETLKRASKLLEKYFRENSTDKIKTDIKSVGKLKFDGPSAKDYFARLNQNQKDKQIPYGTLSYDFSKKIDIFSSWYLPTSSPEKDNTEVYLKIEILKPVHNNINLEMANIINDLKHKKVAEPNNIEVNRCDSISIIEHSGSAKAYNLNNYSLCLKK